MKLVIFALFLGSVFLVNSFTIEERDGGVSEVLKPQKIPFHIKDLPVFRKPPVQLPLTENTEKDGGNPTPKQSCSCGILNPNGATRIVGGNQTKTGEIPWRVAIFIYDPNSGLGHLCGATIISANWLMTAAHCTDGAQASGQEIIAWTEAQDNPVRGGGGIQQQVDRYVQHPAYNSQTKDSDISLLHLASPLTFKTNVSPACLPFNMVGQTFSGTSVLASGWGTTNPVPVDIDNEDPASGTLLQVTLPVLSTTECQEYLGNVNDNNICTYNPGHDTCQGDSGGSIDLLSNSRYYAIGVVSWGNGCAQTDYPGVYAKVTNYLPWIQSTTADTFCKI